MNKKKTKKVKLPKAPKSIDDWVWGNYHIDEKDNIVTEPGADSGFKCPFPTCNRESKTKRKERFRDHLRTHNVNWKIPSMKEKKKYFYNLKL